MSTIDLELQDYRRWKNENVGKRFSLSDYVYGVLRTQEVSADVLLGMAGLLWPDFVVDQGSVFLRSEFDTALVSQLRSQGIEPRDVELWANMFCVDGLFRELKDSSDAAVEFLAARIRDSWAAKLRCDFPELTFKVSVYRDNDVGDVCVSFCERNR